MNDFERAFGPLIRLFAPLFNSGSAAPAKLPEPLPALQTLDFSTGESFRESCAVWAMHVEKIDKGTKQIEALMAKPGFAMDSSNAMLPAMRAFLEGSQASLNYLVAVVTPDVRMRAAILIKEGGLSFSDFEKVTVSVLQKQTAVDASVKDARKTFNDLREKAAAQISEAHNAAVRQALSSAAQDIDTSGVVVSAKVTTVKL